MILGPPITPPGSGGTLPPVAPPSPPGDGGPPPPGSPPPSSGPPTVSTESSYVLVGSYTTVQVVSPTLVNDVVYSTIQTQPTGVIASRPVQLSVFDAGDASIGLTNFAQAIETVMADPRIVAGVGSQTIDASGLLTDGVVFTVEYRDPTYAPNGATAQVTIGVDRLDFSPKLLGATFQAGVMADIDAVYANLKAAAGG